MLKQERLLMSQYGQIVELIIVNTQFFKQQKIGMSKAVSDSIAVHIGVGNSAGVSMIPSELLAILHSLWAAPFMDLGQIQTEPINCLGTVS